MALVTLEMGENSLTGEISRFSEHFSIAVHTPDFSSSCRTVRARTVVLSVAGAAVPVLPKAVARSKFECRRVAALSSLGVHVPVRRRSMGKGYVAVVPHGETLCRENSQQRASIACHVVLHGAFSRGARRAGRRRHFLLRLTKGAAPAPHVEKLVVLRCPSVPRVGPFTGNQLKYRVVRAQAMWFCPIHPSEAWPVVLTRMGKRAFLSRP